MIINHAIIKIIDFNIFLPVLTVFDNNFLNIRLCAIT